MSSIGYFIVGIVLLWIAARFDRKYVKNDVKLLTQEKNEAYYRDYLNKLLPIVTGKLFLQ